MKLIWILIIIVFFGLTTIYAHQDEHHMMAQEKMRSKEDAGICPVMRQPASKEYACAYEGKTYYFCCQACREKFKNDPQKYISKIKEIKFEAFQYGFSPDPLIVSKDDIVKLIVSSRDTTHGVYIKEYGINVIIKKGETKKIEFLADKEGEFDIKCSVYCGPGHSGMKAKLIVKK